MSLLFSLFTIDCAISSTSFSPTFDLLNSKIVSFINGSLDILDINISGEDDTLNTIVNKKNEFGKKKETLDNEEDEAYMNMDIGSSLDILDISNSRGDDTLNITAKNRNESVKKSMDNKEDDDNFSMDMSGNMDILEIHIGGGEDTLYTSVNKKNKIEKNKSAKLKSCNCTAVAQTK